MKMLHILLAALTALAFTTCRKNEENLVCTDENTYKIDRKALDYFFFEKGSWWVYREKNSGVTDSIWAARDTTYYTNPPNSGKRECQCGWGKCVENASLIFENRSHNKKEFDDYLYGYSIGVGLYEQSTEIGEDASFYFTTDYMRWVIQHGVIKPSAGKMHLQDVDTFSVRGQQFKNVLHTWYEKPNEVGDWLHEAWYAKNMHLIKFIKEDSTQWELVKYNIVQ